MSHGQASVERGFSVNKDTLKTNMAEKTLTAKRVVIDGIKSQLGVHNLHQVYNGPITKKLMESCRSARMRYSVYLQDQEKKRKTEAGKRKQLVMLEITEMKAEKQKLESNSARMIGEANELSRRAEQEEDFS